MVRSRSYLQFGIIDSVNDASGTVGISQKYIHPNYGASNVEVHNDIAILKLASTVDFNSYVKPIILPVVDNVMIEDNGVITGWGYYYSNEQIINKTSRFLQKATVSFIGQKMCKNRWQYLDDSQLCAGNYLRGRRRMSSQTCREAQTKS
uniref:Peptidase S1 domain-containing protein n=1 Tax=Acrobeloides nanus TaxID=290746 RepID=A0A914E4B0_9BILA